MTRGCDDLADLGREREERDDLPKAASQSQSGLEACPRRVSARIVPVPPPVRHSATELLGGLRLRYVVLDLVTDRGGRWRLLDADPNAQRPGYRSPAPWRALAATR
jgi:hypothetical protein